MNHPLRWLTAVILAGLAISGCPRHSAPQPLNSERIEHLFGSYGIEVLESNGRVRVSNLYSSEPTGRVCRTFAVVLYPTEVDVSFAPPHQRIISGGSIGATFKQHGWSIEKHHRYFGELEVDAGRRRLVDLMGLSTPVQLAVHHYVLAISKAGVTFEYATIVEVHHPDYLRFNNLRKIYPKEAKARSTLGDPTRQLLELVRLKMT